MIFDFLNNKAGRPGVNAPGRPAFQSILRICSFFCEIQSCYGRFYVISDSRINEKIRVEREKRTKKVKNFAELLTNRQNCGLINIEAKRMLSEGGSYE